MKSEINEAFEAAGPCPIAQDRWISRDTGDLKARKQSLSRGRKPTRVPRFARDVTMVAPPQRAKELSRDSGVEG